MVKKLYGGRSTIRGAEAWDILTRGIEDPITGQIIALVNVSDLQIDPLYQRELNHGSLDRIRRAFNPKAVGIFQVNQRKVDKNLYVSDGQHRKVAIDKRHEDNLQAIDGIETPSRVLAMIEPQTTMEIEAEKFVQFNTNKPVTGNAKFRARLRMKNAQPERQIENILQSEGFELSFAPPGRPAKNTHAANGIYCVNYLLPAFSYCGAACLQQACQLLRMTNGDDPKLIPWELRRGDVLYGFSLYLASQPGNINLNHVARKILGYNCLLESWLDTKRGSGSPIAATSDWARPAALHGQIHLWVHGRQLRRAA